MLQLPIWKLSSGLRLPLQRSKASSPLLDWDSRIRSPTDSHLRLADITYLSRIRTSSRNVLDDVWGSDNLHVYQQNQASKSRALAKSQYVKVHTGVLAMPFMGTGTAGILIFDEPVFGIRSVEVGFDLAFRAVVILTTGDSDGSNLALVGTGKYESLIRYRGVSAGVNIPKYGSHNFSSLASDTWNDLEGRGSSDRPTCVGTGVYVFTRQTADERNELRWKFLPCGERYERERRPVPVIYFHLRKRVGIEVLTEMNYWELSMRVPGYERNDLELTEEYEWEM